MIPSIRRVAIRYIAARDRIDPVKIFLDLTQRTSRDVLELESLGTRLSQLGLGDQAKDIQKCVRLMTEVRKELSAEANMLRREQQGRAAGRKNKKTRTRHRVLEIPLASTSRPAPSFNKMEPQEVLGYLRWLLVDFLEMEDAKGPLKALGQAVEQNMKLIRRRQRFQGR